MLLYESKWINQHLSGVVKCYGPFAGAFLEAAAVKLQSQIIIICCSVTHYKCSGICCGSHRSRHNQKIGGKKLPDCVPTPSRWQDSNYQSNFNRKFVKRFFLFLSFVCAHTQTHTIMHCTNTHVLQTRLCGTFYFHGSHKQQCKNNQNLITANYAGASSYSNS